MSQGDTGHARLPDQKHWIKDKNRKHPAMSRVMDAFA